MSDPDYAELERLARAATPGPWKVTFGHLRADSRGAPGVKGVVYVVVTQRYAHGDIVGTAVTEADGPLWSHLSSDIEWLRQDLTAGFTDRRDKLAAKFPDGYTVVVVDMHEPLPMAIERHFEEPPE